MMKNRERVKRFQGVYYRVSENRPYHKGKPDMCFDISYKDMKGRKVWEKVGWTSEGYTAAYAFQLRAERMRAIRHGDEVVPVQKKQELAFTLDDVEKKYREWAEVNKKDSLNDKSRYDNHIKPELGKKALREITPLEIEDLKEKLRKKGLSPKTIHLCLGLLRAIFRKAISWKMFSGPPPTSQVKFPKLDNRRLRFLTYEEAANLLEELSTRSTQVHDQSLLSLQCGLRFGEIANLSWQDIDLENQIIHIRSPKSGESRQAFMTAQVLEMLRGRNEQAAEAKGLVFPDTNGEKQKGVSNAFERAVEKLKLNEGVDDRVHKMVFHSLRHTFASWLALQGTPLYEIKELMGHREIKMTERYAHLIPDQKRKAVIQLSASFEKACRIADKEKGKAKE